MHAFKRAIFSIAFVFLTLLTLTIPSAAKAAASMQTPPLFINEPEEGQLLKADRGIWTASQPITYGYTWRYRAPDNTWKLFASTNVPEVVLPPESINTIVSLVVNAQTDPFTIATYEIQKGTYAAGIEPTIKTEQKIIGNFASGSTLSIQKATWNQGQIDFEEYTWYVCPAVGNCRTAPPNSDGSLTLTGAQVGSTVELSVLASRPAAGFTEHTVSSTIKITRGDAVKRIPEVGTEVRNNRTTLFVTRPTEWDTFAYAPVASKWQKQVGSSWVTVATGIDSYQLVKGDEASDFRFVDARNSDNSGIHEAISVPIFMGGFISYVSGNVEITSSLKAGEDLTATHPTWTWVGPDDRTMTFSVCDSDKTNCSVVATNPVGNAIELDAAYAGKIIKVVSTMSSTVDSRTAWSGIITIVPIIETTPFVVYPSAQNAIKTYGEWSGENLVIHYKWERLDNGTWTDLNVDRDSIYRDIDFEDGYGAEFRVTVTVSSGKLVYTNTKNYTIPLKITITTPSSISGEVRTGKTLTGIPNVFSGQGNTTYESWYVCALPSGGNCDYVKQGTTYVVRDADFGKYIEFVSNGSNDSSVIGSKVRTTKVLGKPVATKTPFIYETGWFFVDQSAPITLARQATWTYDQELEVKYQWQSSSNSSTGFVDIPGATGLEYTPKYNDYQKYLRIKSTAVYAEGEAYSYSPSTDPIHDAYPNGDVLKLGEEPNKLVLSGDLKPAVDVVYAWKEVQANGYDVRDVGNGTREFTYTKANWGKSYYVVTVIRNREDTFYFNSNRITIKGPVVSIAAASLSKNTEVGESIVIDKGTWENVDGFDYKWQLCPASNDAGCTDLLETSNKLDLQNDYKNSFVKATVIAKNSINQEEQVLWSDKIIKTEVPVVVVPTPTPTPTPETTPTEPTPTPTPPNADVPVVPETPKTPVVPETPNAPEEPKTPVVPTPTPETPETPTEKPVVVVAPKAKKLELSGGKEVVLKTTVPKTIVDQSKIKFTLTGDTKSITKIVYLVGNKKIKGTGVRSRSIDAKLVVGKTVSIKVYYKNNKKLVSKTIKVSLKTK